jgi:hypothetical protein
MNFSFVLVLARVWALDLLPKAAAGDSPLDLNSQVLGEHWIDRPVGREL